MWPRDSIVHNPIGEAYGGRMSRAARRIQPLVVGAACVAMLAFAAAARAQDAQPSTSGSQTIDPMATHVDHSADPAMVVPASPDVDPGINPLGNRNGGPNSPPAIVLSPGLPEKPQAQGGENYVPITMKERLMWLLDTTLGPSHLAGGVVSAAYGTAVDKPPEDGPHWSGFAERYGVRLTGIATSNVMEAGLGAFWGEDPRYKSARGKSFGERVESVLLQTVETRKRGGEFSPAYARCIAFSASNFLSNAWRPDSEADSYHAGLRIGEAFGGQLASNTWDEFWPSVHDKLFHKH